MEAPIFMRPASPCTPRDLAAAIAAVLGPATALSGLIVVAQRLRARPELIDSLLGAFCSHPDRLDKLAQASIWHENGFAKIRLLARHSFSLRLHIWPASTTRSGDTNPHGHRWDFASWVAVGEGLKETSFTESHIGEADAELHVRCEYGAANQPDFLQPLGPAWLLQQPNEVHHTAGTVYPCPAGILHKVTPVGDQLVATLVLRGPKITGTAPVFVHPERPPDPPPRSISTDELSDLLVKFQEAMSQRAGAVASGV